MRPRRVVLVVDDQAMTREVVGAMLEHDEIEVHSAATAGDALAAAARIRPDVVLLDVMMEGSNGFDVCRELVATYGADAPRIVMLTGRSDDEARKEAIDAGASGYLVKPFSAIELFRVVDEEPVHGA
jgi:two-component system, OmpR family, phosphate regulon response regulator PhoB